MTDRTQERERFEADLVALAKEEAEGARRHAELRARLAELLDEYLRTDRRTTSELESSIDEVLQQYDGLHDAKDRVAFLESLQRSLAG